MTSGIKQANWLVTVGVRLKPEFPGTSRDNSTTKIPCRGDDEDCGERSVPPFASVKGITCTDLTVPARTTTSTLNTVYRVVEKYPRVYGGPVLIDYHYVQRYLGTVTTQLPNRKLFAVHHVT